MLRKFRLVLFTTTFFFTPHVEAGQILVHPKNNPIVKIVNIENQTEFNLTIVNNQDKANAILGPIAHDENGTTYTQENINFDIKPNQIVYLQNDPINENTKNKNHLSIYFKESEYEIHLQFLDKNLDKRMLDIKVSDKDLKNMTKTLCCNELEMHLINIKILYDNKKNYQY